MGPDFGRASGAGALGVIPTRNTWIVLSHTGHMLSAKYLAPCD